MSRHLVWRLASPIRSLLARNKRAAAAVQGVLERAPVLLDVVHSVARGDPVERYRRWIEAYDTPGEAELEDLRRSNAGEPRLLSLVIPVEAADASALEALTGSLSGQIHERWEAHLVGSLSFEPGAAELLRAVTEADRRYRCQDGGASVAEALNGALEAAVGDVVVLVDPRCVLRPHALLALAREASAGVVLAYADDDVLGPDGTRSDHYFKPDWNPALLRSQEYLGGLVAFSPSRALEVGGFRDEADGEHAWGLFLRLTTTAAPGTVRHLPFVLSHWLGERPAPLHRDDPGRGARAHQERIALIGQPATVEPIGEASYRMRYPLPDGAPEVTVVIPTTAAPEVLQPCLDGVLGLTSYPKVDVVLVVNDAHADAAERRDYLEELSSSERVRILAHDDRAFNFSWANNLAVREARGDLICFLNDDTEVISGDWLSAMVAHALQDGVGAVGALLLFPSGRIQHAGVVLGAGGIAAHAYAGRPRETPGYHDRALVDQDLSCVSAACMLVRREALEQVGGFDEQLPIAFNDVDLCIRLRRAGWRIVWTPSAELYHRESESIGPHNAGSREGQWAADWDLIQTRWGPELLSDPHYNPNLSLDALELWELAFPPRVPSLWDNAETTVRADLPGEGGPAVAAG